MNFKAKQQFILTLFMGWSLFVIALNQQKWSDWLIEWTNEINAIACCHRSKASLLQLRYFKFNNRSVCLFCLLIRAFCYYHWNLIKSNFKQIISFNFIWFKDCLNLNSYFIMSVMVGPKRHAGLMQNSPAKFLNDQVYREDVDISAGYYIHHHKLGEGNFFHIFIIEFYS